MTVANFDTRSVFHVSVYVLEQNDGGPCMLHGLATSGIQIFLAQWHSKGKSSAWWLLCFHPCMPRFRGVMLVAHKNKLCTSFAVPPSLTLSPETQTDVGKRTTSGLTPHACGVYRREDTWLGVSGRPLQSQGNAASTR